MALPKIFLLIFEKLEGIIQGFPKGAAVAMGQSGIFDFLLKQLELVEQLIDPRILAQPALKSFQGLFVLLAERSGGVFKLYLAAFAHFL